MLWRLTVTLKITVTGKSVIAFAINYGVTDALAPGPLHCVVNVMTVTINNNTVSQNMQETLPIILRIVETEEFSKYDSMTPTALDYLANYDDAVQQMEFQLDASDAVGLAGQRPIVYFPTPADAEPSAKKSYAGRHTSYMSYPNNVLAYDMNRPAGTAYYHKPRGSWQINNIYALNAGAARSPLITDTKINVEFTVTELLLLSPFCVWLRLRRGRFLTVFRRRTSRWS